jgi:hypothetical protein
LNSKLHRQEEHVKDSLAIQAWLCSCGHGFLYVAVAPPTVAIAVTAGDNGNKAVQDAI